VALLSVAAAFLLIGVQGTALIRFGGGSASVELDLRVAAVVRRADEAAEQDPQLALGILEGAAIVEPRVGPDAKAALMLGYQSAVRRALERIQPDGAIVTTAPPPADLTIVTPTKPYWFLLSFGAAVESSRPIWRRWSAAGNWRMR
jgi:hypothetical protein